MDADTSAAEINTTADETKRVYVDITREMDSKIRIRCFLLEAQTGKKVTRREYLEMLIKADIAQVSGASLREVKSRLKR